MEYLDVKPDKMRASGYVELADAAAELGIGKGKLRDAIRRGVIPGCSARSYYPGARSWWVHSATLADVKSRTAQP